jgi:protein involved in sex pheromone biosynthesis
MMKKIALTVAAFASLGLVACSGGADEADTNVTNVEATTENAVEDVTTAENAAVNAADNALDNAVDAAANVSANAQ